MREQCVQGCLVWARWSGRTRRRPNSILLVDRRLFRLRDRSGLAMYGMYVAWASGSCTASTGPVRHGQGRTTHTDSHMSAGTHAHNPRQSRVRGTRHPRQRHPSHTSTSQLRLSPRRGARVGLHNAKLHMPVTIVRKPQQTGGRAA
eukprot:743695-Prymnesium_polylepis.1